MDPEANTPDQQVQTPDQQAPPDGFVEKNRFTGAVQKIETLTNANKSLSDDLAAKNQALATLQQQLADKEAEAGQAITGLNSNLESLNTQLSGLSTENKQLKAFQIKVNKAKEMGRYDLLPILEHLPNFEDATQLEAALKDFAGFADQAASAREAQLRAGITNTTVSPTQNATPATGQAWISAIEKLPLGSPERAEMTSRFGDFLEAQNKVNQ